jgi:hypothetical protein
MYVPGDKVKKEHLNALIALLGDGFSGEGFVSSQGDIVQKTRPKPTDDVVIIPQQAMPRYSAYVVTNNNGLDPFAYDADTKKPLMKVTRLDVQSSGDALMVTNDGVAISANQRGYGRILREGEFAWVQADENCTGPCGIDPSTGKLKQGWPGFISGGFANIDGALCAYVTRYRSLLIGKAVSGGGGQWSRVNVTLYKTNVNIGPLPAGLAVPPLTTAVIPSINLAPSTVRVGGTCLLVPNNGLYFCVEVC